jgi:hypothetical protein
MWGFGSALAHSLSNDGELYLKTRQRMRGSSAAGLGAGK